MGGGGAIVAYPLFQTEDGGASPTSPLQFTIEIIGIHTAVKLNSEWHSRLPIYNTGFCLTATICFGAFYGGKYYAAAIWSPPVSPGLPAKSFLELRRMAICSEAPKNTASRMIKIMTMIIKKEYPHIEKLISYQDKEVHSGTIYKASGWTIGAIHRGGSWSRPKSKNTYNKKPRTRPDLNNATGIKIRWEKIIKEAK